MKYSLLSLFKFIINFFYPSVCLSCNCNIMSYNSLCHVCWNKISFISNPSCFLCGKPKDFSTSECQCANNKEDLIQDYRKNIKVISATVYNDVTKKYIFNFKFEKLEYLKELIGKIILTRLRSEKVKVDVILPVPLHKKRLSNRGFNQSLLIGNVLRKGLGVNIIKNAIIRTKDNKSQIFMTSESERINNVKGIFDLNVNKLTLLSNKDIMLVDDVISTGSTSNECAKLLIESGCRSVLIVSFSKTI